MVNKEYIKRICDLTCSKSDVEIPLKDIEYDLNNPFKKYYNVEIIMSAIAKYVNKEWDVKTLSHWASAYNNILNGGFKDNVNSTLTSLEAYLVKYLSMDLDVLLLIDYKQDKQVIQNYICDTIKYFYNINHIFKTINEWQGFYGVISNYEYPILNQYVVLINETKKEFIIMSYDISIDASEFSILKHLPKQEFIDIITKINANNYKILPCSEYDFYNEIRQ